MSTKPETGLATLHQRPVELLQNLIRFDTTNPPGNEVACIGYINEVLSAAGFETMILARDESRANLVTRLAGQGQAPPLLMYGHVDVVTTEGQQWTHPPFDGTIADARHFSRLGIHTYGFTPMKIPPDLNVWRLAHGADERIPVDAMAFDTEAIYKLLQRFGKVN